MQPDHAAAAPAEQPLVDDRVVDHVREPGRRAGDLAAARGVGDEPLGGALGRRVHLSRVRAQGLARRSEHEPRHLGFLRSRDDVPGAEHVGGHGAVDLALGEPRIALRGQVEHHVGTDLTEDRGQAGPVPDVRVEVLGSREPRPSAGQAAADADQPRRAPAGDLRHQRRADAAGPAGHQDGRAAEPFGELRLGNRDAPLAKGQEPLVLLARVGSGGDQRLRQAPQFSQHPVVGLLPPGRRGLVHRRDDLRRGRHS